MRDYEEDRLYGTREEQLEDEHIESLGNEVLRKLHDIGINDDGICKLFAKLLAETHEDWHESVEISDKLGLDEMNFWCFLGDKKSMEKYRRQRERDMPEPDFD